jgi:hypothetical protein
MTPDVGGNRLTSFFVYVAAGNLTGGGTNFPILNQPYDEQWCEFLDCDEPWDNGVTFRPVPGNAVFWQNLLEDGTGDPATIHAGLPVTSGYKLGMNIWTRQGPLDEFTCFVCRLRKHFALSLNHGKSEVATMVRFVLQLTLTVIHHGVTDSSRVEQFTQNSCHQVLAR